MSRFSFVFRHTLGRIFMAGDRFFLFVLRMWAVFRDEFGCALAGEQGSLASTVTAYARHNMFLPGGDCFREGLFAWEKEMIRNPPFPSHGHILVGGCGGGREMQSLIDFGYSVSGFEPSPYLLAGAKEVVANSPTSQAFLGSYQDLLDAMNGTNKEFSNLLNKRPIDGVILGWTSISYVPKSEKRLEIFQAIRKLAPRAPVLASYYLRNRPPSGRLRKTLRSMIKAMGLTPAEDGDFFSFDNGFGHVFNRSEIETMAHEAGYKIVKAYWYVEPQPYVLLTPL